MADFVDPVIFKDDVEVLGSFRAQGPHGVDVERTVEALTIELNSGTGTDNANGMHYNTQAQFDALGAFQTVPAVIEALPDRIRHDVTLVFPDGTWTLDSEGLGRLERFIFEGDPAIIFEGTSGLVREVATSTYAVAAGTTKRQLVLQSDPGFSADDHQSKYARIVSGTGAGQYKPIRNHAGVTWNVAGRFSPVPDATSVMEIILPATLLQTAERYIDIETHQVEVFERNVRFVSLDLRSTNTSPRLRIRGAFARFEEGTRLMKMGLQAYGAGISIVTCVFDGENGAIGVSGLNSYFRSSSSSEAWLIRNVQNIGVTLGAVGKGASSAVMWEGSIDDVVDPGIGTGHAIRADGMGTVMNWLGRTIQGSGNDGLGMDLINGATAKDIDTTIAIAEPETLTGAGGDFALDGVVQTYADLDNADNKQLTTGARTLVAGEL